MANLTFIQKQLIDDVFGMKKGGLIESIYKPYKNVDD